MSEGAPRKVAIVGSADTTRDLAPFTDPSWEVWTLNDMCLIAPRFDRHFELHSQRILARDAEPLAGQLDWMRRNTTVPIWMAEPADDISQAIQFPTETITKEFGTYFTNSISWMMALAIYEGVEVIGLWGVDMAHGTEYAAQRPSCEYFIGLARGRGIEVYIPEQSDLLKCRQLYGLENDDFGTNIENRLAKLQQQGAEFSRQKTEAMLNEAKIAGAIEILTYVNAAWR